MIQMIQNPVFFGLEELLNSPTALAKKIPNLPSWEGVEKLKRLAVEILDPIRKKLGKPVHVGSGYRCPALNKAVKGAKNSQHTQFEAADIESDNNRELWDLVKKMVEDGEIVVGQLIWEYGTKQCPGWVHVSLPTEKHRNQILYIGVK